MTSTWQEISIKKKAEQATRIPRAYLLPKHFKPNAVNVLHVPRTCGLLSQRQIDITENNDATSLAAAIAGREYSSLEVAEAFCKRAAIAHQLVRNVTYLLNLTYIYNLCSYALGRTTMRPTDWLTFDPPYR
jgi:amidase